MTDQELINRSLVKSWLWWSLIWLTFFPIVGVLVSIKFHHPGFLLQMRTGTYREWIIRKVVHDHGHAQDESGSMPEVRGCPILVAPLEPSVQRPITLHTPVRVF